MWLLFVSSLLAMTVVNGLPSRCTEDRHCTETYFCDLAKQLCRECLQCYDLGRNKPLIDEMDCIKSGVDCGTCITGLVYYKGNVDAKCVHAVKFKFTIQHMYMLLTGVLFLLWMVIFLHILNNVIVVKIQTLYSMRTSPPMVYKATIKTDCI